MCAGPEFENWKSGYENRSARNTPLMCASPEFEN
jgi:hypothetical protein